MSLLEKHNFSYDNETGERTYTYKSEYPEMLLEHMAEGYDFESFGAVVNVCRQTLYNWERTIPEFKHAHQVGIAKFSKFWQTDMKKNRMKGKAYVFRVPELFMKNVASWTNRVTIEGNPSKPLAIDFTKITDKELDKVIGDVLG